MYPSKYTICLFGVAMFLSKCWFVDIVKVQRCTIIQGKQYTLLEQLLQKTADRQLAPNLPRMHFGEKYSTLTDQQRREQTRSRPQQITSVDNLPVKT